MTLAAVPSTDPADFLLNVNTFDTAINSTSSTFVDRLGVARSTLKGAIDSLKAWNERGQWLTATAYAVKDVYTNSGLAYAVLIAHTSTSIAADLASGKVSIHQGVTFAALADAAGSALIGYTQGGTGAASRTVEAKQREIVSVSDFAGYDRTGATSSVTAINAALAASKHVIVPSGHTPLIDATITVPGGKTLEFKGAPGNPAVNPGSYFIKKATMTTVGIILNQCSTLINGGLVCQPGNTGGGIVLAQNAAKAIRPFVSHAGGVGIRVGTDAGDNSNNTELIHPVTVSNGSHGIYVHDGFGDDANAGVIQQPVCVTNGGDGVRIGHAYWVTVIAGNCEINAGWGLYLSGANRETYPEARWVNVIGGDYNEGNSLGAVHDASYFSTFTNADSTNFPTTAPNGLQGSAQRTFVGGVKSVFPAIETYRTQSIFYANGTPDPVVIRAIGTGSVGDGAGINFELDRSGTGAGPFVRTANVKSWSAGAVDGLMFRANNAAGVMETQVIMTPYYGGTVPGADNARILGHPAFRWSTVYAASSAINTSDARCKQQWDTDLAPELKAWAKVNFGKFKFNDAVALKGDSARWHFGVIAQQVKEAFESEGLDPFKYGVLCYDEWEEMPAQIDADGSEVTPATPAGSRFGVRYDEALALECAYLRSKLD